MNLLDAIDIIACMRHGGTRRSCPSLSHFASCGYSEELVDWDVMFPWPAGFRKQARHTQHIR